MLQSPIDIKITQAYLSPYTENRKQTILSYKNCINKVNILYCHLIAKLYLLSSLLQ